MTATAATSSTAARIPSTAAHVPSAVVGDAPAPDNKRKSPEEDQPAPGRRSGRATQPSSKLVGSVSWDAVHYSGESIHYSSGGTSAGSSSRAAKGPRVARPVETTTDAHAGGQPAGPRQSAIDSGDRCKSAHNYSRRTAELPVELQGSEEAEDVWRAAQQASSDLRLQEVRGWRIEYKLRGTGTAAASALATIGASTSGTPHEAVKKQGDLYLYPPAEPSGQQTRVVRSMSALHDVLLVRVEAQQQGGGAWQPPPRGHWVELHEPDAPPPSQLDLMRAFGSAADGAAAPTCTIDDDGQMWRRATVLRVELGLGGRFQVSMLRDDGQEEERKEWLWKDSEGTRWRRVAGQAERPSAVRARGAFGRLGDQHPKAALQRVEAADAAEGARHVLLREVAMADGTVVLEAVPGGTAGDGPFGAEALLRLPGEFGWGDELFRNQSVSRPRAVGGGGGGGGGGGVRARRCGLCTGCQVKGHCGECRACKNMPRFGGPGTAKQCCVRRKCANPVLPAGGGGGGGGSRGGRSVGAVPAHGGGEDEWDEMQVIYDDDEVDDDAEDVFVVDCVAVAGSGSY